jgi:hypothetical protein
MKIAMWLLLVMSLMLLTIGSGRAFAHGSGSRGHHGNARSHSHTHYSNFSRLPAAMPAQRNCASADRHGAEGRDCAEPATPPPVENAGGTIRHYDR